MFLSQNWLKCELSSRYLVIFHVRHIIPWFVISNHQKCQNLIPICCKWTNILNHQKSILFVYAKTGLVLRHYVFVFCMKNHFLGFLGTLFWCLWHCLGCYIFSCFVSLLKDLKPNGALCALKCGEEKGKTCYYEQPLMIVKLERKKHKHKNMKALPLSQSPPPPPFLLSLLSPPLFFSSLSKFYKA